MSTTSNFNTVRVLSKSEFENNFISTSNDTLYFVEMDNTMFDGQWVHKYLLANTNATKGLYSIDLSEYLPDNLYWYEIIDSTKQPSMSGVTTSGYATLKAAKSDSSTNAISIDITNKYNGGHYNESI